VLYENPLSGCRREKKVLFFHAEYVKNVDSKGISKQKKESKMLMPKAPPEIMKKRENECMIVCYI
jgi:hypothetical protein